MEIEESRWDKHRRQGWKRRNNLATSLVLVALGLLMWLAWEMRAIVVAVLFSITLASAIAPVAESLEKRKIPRAATVLLVYIFVGALYAVLFASLFPTLKEQALSLYEKLPSYASGLNDMNFRIREMFGESVGAISVSPNDIRGFVSKLSGHALHFGSDILTVIVSGILVLFLTGYFVVEARDIWEKLLEWVPQEHRARAAGLIRPMEGRLGGYIRGQLLVSVAVSLFLIVGLSALQVEHALLLGSLSGLLNLVPFVGSMITAVLAVLVAFSQSPWLALATVLLFAVEQLVESNVIVPNLMGKQVELHPLMVLFSILIGASIMGVPGALIAVPLATASMFLAEEFYLKPLKQKEAGEATAAANAGQSASGQHSVHRQIQPDRSKPATTDDGSTRELQAGDNSARELKPTTSAPAGVEPSGETVDIRAADRDQAPNAERPPTRLGQLPTKISQGGAAIPGGDAGMKLTAEYPAKRPKEEPSKDETTSNELDDTIPPESQGER